MSQNNYRLGNCQRMVADIKADATMDDASKTELLAFADKVMSAESKMCQDALTMVAKYSVSSGIDATQPDEGEDDYY